jgi:histidinol-phosphate aminotransferase
MPVSRRTFLQSAALATTATAVLDLSFPALLEARTSRTGFIILNSNENAYGPSPRVIQAMRDALPFCNRYPDAQRDDFLSSVAQLHHVSYKQLIMGHGSTELLRMCVDAFAGPGKKVITATPTFEVISWCAKARGAEVVTVPLTPNYAHDLGAMLDKVDANTTLVYICNPNNPTASITPRADIETFIGKLPAHTYVLIDEAYHEFAAGSPGYRSFIEDPVRIDHVIVSRTMSKIYGLAGLRLGYGFSAPQTIQLLQPHQLDQNANMVALMCSVVALGDQASITSAIARNAADRSEFMRQAQSRNIRYIPSHTNFVMMYAGRPAPPLIEAFKQRNILIGRPFPPMDNFVRISLGLPDEMKTFWSVWDDVAKASA